MSIETTFIMLKPDTVQRRLCGEILARFERKGLQIVGAKMLTISDDLANKHYQEHIGKSFFPTLLEFITSGPVLALAISGIDAVEVTRKLIGSTNGRTAAPGTIRGDFGMSGAKNLVHGSDSAESAARELAIWFSPDELQAQEAALKAWTYAPIDYT